MAGTKCEFSLLLAGRLARGRKLAAFGDRTGRTPTAATSPPRRLCRRISRSRLAHWDFVPMAGFAIVAAALTISASLEQRRAVAARPKSCSNSRFRIWVARGHGGEVACCISGGVSRPCDSDLARILMACVQSRDGAAAGSRADPGSAGRPRDRPGWQKSWEPDPEHGEGRSGPGLSARLRAALAELGVLPTVEEKGQHHPCEEC